MNEQTEPRPRYQVAGSVERCRTCGGAEGDGCLDHQWQPMRWPALPPKLEVATSSEYVEPLERGRTGEIRARADHRPTGRVALAKYVRTGAEWAMHRTPTAEEFRHVEQVALLLLARQLCRHVDQQVWAGLARLTDKEPTKAVPMPETIGYQLDIRAWCADCGEPFVFVGDDLRVGLSPGHPTVDVEGTTLSAPLRPVQYPEGWGLNRLGYGIRAL